MDIEDLENETQNIQDNFKEIHSILNTGIYNIYNNIYDDMTIDYRYKLMLEDTIETLGETYKKALELQLELIHKLLDKEEE